MPQTLCTINFRCCGSVNTFSLHDPQNFNLTEPASSYHPACLKSTQASPKSSYPPIDISYQSIFLSSLMQMLQKLAKHGNADRSTHEIVMPTSYMSHFEHPAAEKAAVEG